MPDPSLVSLIKESTPLVQRGADDWWAACPLCPEPQTSAALHVRSGQWKCFACGLGGSAVDFVAEVNGVSLEEAESILQGWRPREVEADVSFYN